MIVAPTIAAGRGMRSFIFTAVLEFAVVFFVCLLNFSGLTESLENWRTDGLNLLPFVVLWIFPVTMGGIILYAKSKEEIVPGKVCRVCGYDLRETPVRCPECGTLVHHDPDRF
jgi:hypothetical protein